MMGQFKENNVQKMMEHYIQKYRHQFAFCNQYRATCNCHCQH